jgi:thioredoxin-like negative regulator of GroEL
MMQGDSMMKDEGAMMEKGSYEAYAPEKLAKADTGDVVLFFRAPWCSTCRALDAAIRSSAGEIPGGLTILDVNYDTETALKQKYGVTTQHTLVQVSSDGTLIKKWQGSSDLAALVTQVI